MSRTSFAGNSRVIIISYLCNFHSAAIDDIVDRTVNSLRHSLVIPDVAVQIVDDISGPLASSLLKLC